MTVLTAVAFARAVSAAIERRLVLGGRGPVPRIEVWRLVGGGAYGNRTRSRTACERHGVLSVGGDVGGSFLCEPGSLLCQPGCRAGSPSGRSGPGGRFTLHRG